MLWANNWQNMREKYEAVLFCHAKYEGILFCPGRCVAPTPYTIYANIHIFCIQQKVYKVEKFGFMFEGL